MAYSIEYREMAIEQLAELSTYQQRIVLDEIDEQTTHRPAQTARHKKTLEDFQPDWWDIPLPVWQLRVGDFRVLYGVNETAKLVTIMCVFYKGGMTTGEAIP